MIVVGYRSSTRKILIVNPLDFVNPRLWVSERPWTGFLRPQVYSISEVPVKVNDTIYLLVGKEKVKTKVILVYHGVFEVENPHVTDLSKAVVFVTKANQIVGRYVAQNQSTIGLIGVSVPEKVRDQIKQYK